MQLYQLHGVLHIKLLKLITFARDPSLCRVKTRTPLPYHVSIISYHISYVSVSTFLMRIVCDYIIFVELYR